MIAGCFFIRFILDRLIVSNIRKNTEKLIRDEHHIIDGSGTQTAFYDAAAGSENAEDVEVDALEPIMNRVRNNHRLTQYRKR